MEVSSLTKMLIMLVLVLASFTTLSLGQDNWCGKQGTRVGFYKATCPKVEHIVRKTVIGYAKNDPTVAPGLLNMFFHDCFVNGCDASILLDGPSTELTAPPNSHLRHIYKVIGIAKLMLERSCRGVVSCADILALAARDSVVLTGGRSWKVPLGRRDGLVSRASDTANLPSFTDSITVQIKKFADKGLNTQDLVTLVGGHTIGTTGCASVNYRLYNFNNTNQPDPDINQAFLPQLRALCPNGGDGLRRVALDTGSNDSFDNSYYENLKNERGVLESDAMLWKDQRTHKFVKVFLGTGEKPRLRFNKEFGRAMVKMGNIEVKTGSHGEIRKLCGRTNSELH
ncbi:hypothetical protein L6452_22779 [Arctium lappa]|uniref:Uncharacterized protein n=1 Tax=Arctium lappa TaxID=4217 RepID=A0ACB9AZW4_ARCLA|nr:hypothetical protein L6452_22779 [Arctium lappa]